MSFCRAKNPPGDLFTYHQMTWVPKSKDKFKDADI